MLIFFNFNIKPKLQNLSIRDIIGLFFICNDKYGKYTNNYLSLIANYADGILKK